MTFDSTIPAPIRIQRKPQGTYNFLNDMEIGDSLLVPEDTHIQSFRVSCYLKKPKKFATKKEGSTWRVWRIS